MGEFSLSDNQAFMKKQIENTVRIINSFFDNQELSYTALQNALLSFVENSKQESDEAKFITYTVVEGDTLAKICSEHGLDYKTNINIIIELNNIKDVNLIYVGQKLLLPMGE